MKKTPLISYLTKIYPLLAGVVVIGLLQGCIKTTEDRGYVSRFSAFDKIAQGTSSKEDVKRILGSPSTVSDYGKETWYYISTTSESVAFADPKLVDQKVWFVRFSDAGVVEDTGSYSINDARAIKFAKDYTPTEGNDFSVTEQLLGNLGKYNPKDTAGE
jgi:outer membrane protein assembly factor BamE (lipoprotein component of BamABCDE complex)